MRIRLIAVSLGLALSGGLMAQTPATTPAAPVETAAPTAAPSGPPQALLDLAASTAGDATAGAGKAAACGACHGSDGNSADPQYPKIAGQHEAYIAKQLALFKSGLRANPIMLGFATPLSAQDMRDIGAYFATTKGTPGIASDQALKAGEPLTFAQYGEQLFRGGDRKADVPACMACHGPSGRGNPGPSYPAVGGQHAGYTAKILKHFRDDFVCTEPNAAPDVNANVMACVADRLDDTQIQAVSTYLEGLYTR